MQQKKNIFKAQEKQKDYYDQKRANPQLFCPGQLVLLKDFRRKKRKGGKLDTRYLGPYVITSETGKGGYHLKDKATGKVMKAIGSHLKIYVPSKDNDSP